MFKSNYQLGAVTHLGCFYDNHCADCNVAGTLEWAWRGGGGGSFVLVECFTTVLVRRCSPKKIQYTVSRGSDYSQGTFMKCGHQDIADWKWGLGVQAMVQTTKSWHASHLFCTPQPPFQSRGPQWPSSWRVVHGSCCSWGTPTWVTTDIGGTATAICRNKASPLPHFCEKKIFLPFFSSFFPLLLKRGYTLRPPLWDCRQKGYSWCLQHLNHERMYLRWSWPTLYSTRVSGGVTAGDSGLSVVAPLVCWALLQPLVCRFSTLRPVT